MLVILSDLPELAFVVPILSEALNQEGDLFFTSNGFAVSAGSDLWRKPVKILLIIFGPCPELGFFQFVFGNK